MNILELFKNIHVHESREGFNKILPYYYPSLSDETLNCFCEQNSLNFGVTLNCLNDLVISGSGFSHPSTLVTLIQYPTIFLKIQ